MYHDRNEEKRILTTISLKQSLRRLLNQLLQQGDTYGREASKPEFNAVAPDAAQLLKLARELLNARRRRSDMFAKAMFGEPAWDMLLALYIDQADGPRHSVGRLSNLSGAPATTALRWLDYLEKEQLVTRSANPTDRRSDFVTLTDRGRTTMERYLSETLQSLE